MFDVPSGSPRYYRVNDETTVAARTLIREHGSLARYDGARLWVESGSPARPGGDSYDDVVAADDMPGRDGSVGCAVGR